MRLEQLNKHEEISYIEDAEANEAILKHTVSKDELCRYLSPLKFLEIETWRKEVPYGDKMHEAEVEHRKWRTPIEILLPTAGREDDGMSLSQDSANDTITKEEAARKIKAASAYSRRRKFFEDVQRQNAEVLRRSNSDVTKLEAISSRKRDTFSAGEKTHAQRRNLGQSSVPKRAQTSPENRLRTAYAPANGIPPINESGVARRTKNSGQIYINHATLGPHSTHDAVMTSYFAPGRPVTLSKLRNKTGAEPMRMNSAELPLNSQIDHPMRVISSANARTGISQTTNSRSPQSSAHRVSSSSWPTTANDKNHRKSERLGRQEDVQVLPLNIIRPQTVGEDNVTNRYNLYQRQSKFQGAHRSLNRGWRTWHNRRAIENSLHAATKLYQKSNLPKKAIPSVPSGKVRPTRSSNTGRDTSPKGLQRTASLETHIDQKLLGEDKANLTESTPDEVPNKNGVLANHVTKISYGVSRFQEHKVADYFIAKEREEKSRVTPITPIDMNLPLPKIAPSRNHTHSSAAHDEHSFQNRVSEIKYLTADGIIELSPLQNGKVTSPWVAEAFSPALAASEGYYVRNQRPNKTVTFRLGAT